MNKPKTPPPKIWCVRWMSPAVAPTAATLLPRGNYRVGEELARRVSPFSARGGNRDGIVEATKEDYRELLRAHRARPDEAAEEHRSA
jgi:hypothetical protein